MSTDDARWISTDVLVYVDEQSDAVWLAYFSEDCWLECQWYNGQLDTQDKLNLLEQIIQEKRSQQGISVTGRSGKPVAKQLNASLRQSQKLSRAHNKTKGPCQTGRPTQRKSG